MNNFALSAITSLINLVSSLCCSRSWHVGTHHKSSIFIIHISIAKFVVHHHYSPARTVSISDSWLNSRLIAPHTKPRAQLQKITKDNEPNRNNIPVVCLQDFNKLKIVFRDSHCVSNVIETRRRRGKSLLLRGSSPSPHSRAYFHRKIPNNNIDFFSYCYHTT